MMSSHYEKNIKCLSTRRQSSMFKVVEDGFHSLVGGLSANRDVQKDWSTKNLAKIKSIRYRVIPTTHI